MASSFKRNERLSKSVEPTEVSKPSTVIHLQWHIVGPHSAMTPPALSGGPPVALDALRGSAVDVLARQHDAQPDTALQRVRHEVRG